MTNTMLFDNFAPQASQYLSAMLSSSLFFFNVNLSKDYIYEDSNQKTNSENTIYSILDSLKLSKSNSFTEFTEKWLLNMVPDKNQKQLIKFQNITSHLLDLYANGIREYTINYWGLDSIGKKVFYNQRFLLSGLDNNDVVALCIIKDLTQLKEYDDSYIDTELKKITYIDSLTEGRSYYGIKEEINNKNQPGVIVCFDIRSFKTINSMCGVGIGDFVIRGLWDCIDDFIDKENGELAAHVNADHFILFFPYFDEVVITKKLKHLSLAVYAKSVELNIPQLSPYYGISRWEPGKRIEHSYNEAIIAKNKVKTDSINSIGFFQVLDSDILKKEHLLLDSFEDAMANKEFKIWFQPKYSPSVNKLCGAEALVRWIKRDGTIISPAEFIPMLERNNRISELDEYIFRNVCIYQKEWLDQGVDIVPVSVNLSRASLNYSNIVDKYKKIIDLIGIDPSYIPLEITETAAITNSQIDIITDLFITAGFSLQMDDFGSGYSSLSSLNTKHFDTIKLDKSLIDFIGTFRGDRLLVHTISLAKELGIRITAEGVERSKQVEFLRQNGCDNIQGYFYSKPLDFTMYEKLLFEGVESSIETTEAQKVDLYMKQLVQSFETQNSFTYVINLNSKQIVDYYSYYLPTSNATFTYKDYERRIQKIEKLFPEGEDVRFTNFLNNKLIKKDFENHITTKYFEYEIYRNNEIEKWRIIRHTFKLDNKLYCFLKFFTFE